jgi:hypothetical protein
MVTVGDLLKFLFTCPVAGVVNLVPATFRGFAVVDEGVTAFAAEVEGKLGPRVDGAPIWRGAGVLFVVRLVSEGRRSAGLLPAVIFGIEGNAAEFEVSPIVQVFPS